MAELRISVWIRNLAIAGVILAFVVLFGQPSGSQRGSAVARVGSEQVSREVFEFCREQNAETSRQFLPDTRDADTLRFSFANPHPNAAGHRLLAEALRDGLEALPPRCWKGR